MIDHLEKATVIYLPAFLGRFLSACIVVNQLSKAEVKIGFQLLPPLFDPCVNKKPHQVSFHILSYVTAPKKPGFLVLIYRDYEANRPTMAGNQKQIPSPATGGFLQAAQEQGTYWVQRGSSLVPLTPTKQPEGGEPGCKLAAFHPCQKGIFPPASEKL